MSRGAKVGAALGVGVLVLVAVAVALAVASLGDSDSGNGSARSERGSQSRPAFPGGAPPSDADREALNAFRSCLEAQGVELPDPGSQDGGPPSGFDPSDPELREAFSSCQDKLPEGVGPPQ